MNSFLWIIIVAAFFTFIIFLNILIVRLFIKRGLRKFIIPKLQSYGLTYIDYEWAGLFSSGDFKQNTIIFRPSFGNGTPNISIYIYVDYKDPDKKKRITARIDTFTFFITKVVYSGEFWNINNFYITTTPILNASLENHPSILRRLFRRHLCFFVQGR